MSGVKLHSCSVGGKWLYVLLPKIGLVIPVNPQYTSQLLPYKDEFVFTDCIIREYWDEELNLLVDRDVSAGINTKRVGLGLFPTIKCRKGKTVITNSVTNSTLKEVLTALRGFQKPALYSKS